jgi:hypothetical protein
MICLRTKCHVPHYNSSQVNALEHILRGCNGITLYVLLRSDITTAHTQLGNERRGRMVTDLLRIREDPGSNFRSKTGCSVVFVKNTLKLWYKRLILYHF